MIGAHLGPYRLLSELGSGGMGKVYLAEVEAGGAHGLAAGERVAVKVVHRHLLASPDFLQRFLREAEIGQAVRHPNVVRTYHADTFRHEGHDLHFMVMEYVEGQELRSLLHELGRVPEELCRHIGREVSKGLGAIHAAGAVHRDLKPENVLITRDEVVKVMDLGVARLLDEAMRLSQTGMFVGSLQYAAPEQFEDEGRSVDGRADLHALGLVLYELATGEHPFAGANFRTVMHRILKESPRRMGEINPQLSPFFEEVVHTLLEKDRERRFDSAEDLLEVLEGGEERTWWKARTLAIRIETRRPIRRIRIPRETALYGREAELARLRALYERAKAGDGQVVLLEGEAGIGKTRLVDEFVSQLEQQGEDLSFLFGSYPPGGAATAAGAFTTALREHFGDLALEEALRTYLAVTPLLVPAFAALVRGDATPPGAEPLTKDSLQTVFVHTTRALAAERPTVLLIEDLHFAPEEGRALFAALALAAPGHRVLLIGTTRPGLDPAWASSVDRLDQTSRLALARLGLADLGHLLVDAFHSADLAHELALDIATKSDGNPFFVFEIIRELREGGLIDRRDDGTWSRTQVIRAIQIPSSVLELIQARIAGLEEEDRDLLEMAACWGYEFDPALVAEALGQGVLPVLKRCGKIEKSHRLIRAVGRRYAFDHHQVQEALYAGLFEQIREHYHAALAAAHEARERAAGQDPRALDGGVAAALCDHFLRGASGERALRYLEPALDHLEGAHLHGAAVELAERSLAAAGLLEGGQRIDILVRKTERLDLLGRREEERAAIDEALALADAAGDPAARARVRKRLGWHLTQIARYEEARTALVEAIELAREAGDRRVEVAATGNLGLIYRTLGRSDEARAHQERAQALARAIGDQRAEAIATGNLGVAFLDLGAFDEARLHFARYHDLARAIGYRQGEAIATGNLGTVLGSLGRYDEARAHFERYLTISREIGFRQGEAIAAGNLASVFECLGRYEEARAHHERRLALSREIGFRRGECVALADLGAISTVLGDLDRARAVLEASRALCVQIGARALEATALGGLGAVEEQTGNLAAAERLRGEALALQREVGNRSAIAHTLVELGGLLAGSGRAGEARALLAEGLALAREVEAPNETVLASARLAALPGGDPAAALAAFAAHEARLSHREKMLAHFLLWKATADGNHLEEAYRLLEELRQRAPAASRDTIFTQVPGHREIQAEWRVHGGGATRAATRIP